jgi:hypothetical protein
MTMGVKWEPMFLSAVNVSTGTKPTDDWRVEREKRLNRVRKPAPSNVRLVLEVTS